MKIVRRRRRRSGEVALCSLVALLVPRVSLGAEPDAVGPTVEVLKSAQSGVQLEVRVDRGIEESEVLAGWIVEESRAALAREQDHRGALSIAVEGALYEYAVTIETRRDGDAAATPDTWSCECSNEELLGQIKSRVSSASGRLARDDSTHRVMLRPTNADPSRRTTSEAETLEEGKRRPLNASEKAGIVMMSLGTAGLAAGATLLGISRRGTTRINSYSEASRDLPIRDYEASGTIATVVGGGLLTLGAGLLLARHLTKNTKKPRRYTAAPTIGSDPSVILMLTGRF